MTTTPSLLSLLSLISLSLLLLLLLFSPYSFANNDNNNNNNASAVPSKHHVICRDPDLGGQVPDDATFSRKYVVIHGLGGGIGNFLIFFPAVYFFAALSGRDIAILDDSLFAEMCKVIHCGFPLYSELQAIYPHLPSTAQLRSAKMWDFIRYTSGESSELIPIEVLRADGYKHSSGWYQNQPFAEDCVMKITGCGREDHPCHDRFAYQRLVRGPFRDYFAPLHQHRLVGIPTPMKHGILTLPRAFAPRFHVAVHLRCQFQHFEALTGPEDGEAWLRAVKERDDWLNSTDNNKGLQLFKVIEEKLVQDLPYIKNQASRGSYVSRPPVNVVLDPNEPADREDPAYDASKTEKIHVFISSDNEEVKEALARYLIDHEHIEVMRVKNNGIVVHAKNLGYLKSNGNNTGVEDLVLDWYCLTLSNIIYGWRRDTGLLSTFAMSAQRVSGNNEPTNYSSPIGHGIGTKGYQLTFSRHNWEVWRPFY